MLLVLLLLVADVARISAGLIPAVAAAVADADAAADAAAAGGAP